MARTRMSPRPNIDLPVISSAPTDLRAAEVHRPPLYAAELPTLNEPLALSTESTLCQGKGLLQASRLCWPDIPSLSERPCGQPVGVEADGHIPSSPWTEASRSLPSALSATSRRRLEVEPDSSPLPVITQWLKSATSSHWITPTGEDNLADNLAMEDFTFQEQLLTPRLATAGVGGVSSPTAPLRRSYLVLTLHVTLALLLLCLH
ncbi:unnamed protein product [Pleuronectes platessa]|uniref:Uncharacterized protein n=1 Tax=Pleuronectes platessa TaxID=8262 RepID=A0A9N7TXG3_PLEPL|nr:unnamed protein product [Pleuronectes platessa]